MSKRNPKKGDRVSVVGFADGNFARFNAVIVDVLDKDKVNVEVTIGEKDGEPLKIEIHRSPRDDEGKKPDSWHFPEDAPKPAAAVDAPPKP